MHRDVRAGGGAPHPGVAGRPVPLVIGLLVSALAATAASGTATATTAPLVATARLNVYDAAHTGYRAADFVSRPVARGEYPRVLAGYRRTEPDLVWINLGANDYLNGGGTPAAVAAELTRLVDDLLALPTRPSIVLGVPHRLVGHESPGRTWAQYAAAIQGVAAARGTGLVRLSDVIPTAGLGLPAPERRRAAPVEHRAGRRRRPRQRPPDPDARRAAGVGRRLADRRHGCPAPTCWRSVTR